MFVAVSVYAQNIPCMKIEYKDGQKIMQSLSENVMVGVIIEDEAEFTKDFPIWIGVSALDHSMVVGPGNVKIRYNTWDNTSFTCGVYTKSEALKKIEKKILWKGPSQELRTQKYNIENYYLQKTTINSDDELELKYVVAENGKATAMYVYVTIEGETFEFNLGEEQ
jgi:hypothetical protein